MNKKNAYIHSKKTKVYLDDGFFIMQCGKYSKRRSYAKIDRQVEVPSLVAYQQKSYDEFMTEGIKRICNEIFPIIDIKGTLEIHYIGHSFLDGYFSEEEARIQNRNYDKRLFLDLKIIWNKKDKFDKKALVKKIELTPIKPLKYPKKDEIDNMYTYSNKIYFGTIPILSSRGNFIINGTNKIIIPQILKTPGAYFVKDKIGTTNYWVGKIQPYKGNWLDITLRHDYQFTIYPLYIQFDRSSKGKATKSSSILATVFLRALGLELKDIKDIFENDPYIDKTIEMEDDPGNLYYALNKLESLLTKITTKITKTETIDKLIERITTTLFSKERYSLAIFGREQLNQKLNIFKRLIGNYSYYNIKTKSNEILVKENELINDDIIKMLLNRKSELDIEKKIKIKDGIFKTKQISFVKIKVFTKEKKKDESSFVVLGHSLTKPSKNLNFDIVDILSCISYLLNLEKIRENYLIDDIDHLENRRVRNIGELTLDQFTDGMISVKKILRQRLATIQNDELERYVNSKNDKKGREAFFAYFIGILDPKPLDTAFKTFFNTSQLIQFMDQTNPIAELTNKRKITSLGPRGLDRKWSGEKVRDVHYTHYGRICPVETPEGANIGLIHSLPTFTIIDDFGFLKTPYWKVNKAKLLDPYDENSIVYLSPHEEYSSNYVIASSNTRVDKEGKIITENLPARCLGENIMAHKNEITHLDVSPRQVLSISASCIPFIENDDASRVLMASNMQRQAVPLLIPKAPIVGTGMEYVIARDSSAIISSKITGKVSYVDATRIDVENSKETITHFLSVFENNNQGTSTRHRPLVNVNDMVKKGEIIADGSAIDKGELALGRNLLVAFSTWYGYNFEDAVVVSKRLVKDDVFTSIHVIEYTIECHDSKAGKERFTRDIPYASELMVSNLDENGIVVIGTEVKEGDILVGKVAPYVKSELSPQQELVFALFGQKPKNIKDVSLRVPNGVSGIVQKAIYLRREEKGGKAIVETKTKYKKTISYIQEEVDLKEGIREVVKIYLIQKRKIQEGDKVAGRHGNKGVISIVVPEEDMPFLEDGTPIDVLLSPLGIPSRMNIGQVLELHAGFAAKKLGLKIATPVFEGMNSQDINEIMKEANLNEDGKFDLYNGITGEKFKNKVSVGIMYIMKLAHMVDDKIHARSVGPYSIITQQPLGGKSNNGGQRLGEMEVWALEAYGAAYTLKEMLTIKSDDIFGRKKTYRNIIRGYEIRESGIPEATSVLINELRGLCFNVGLKELDYDWVLESRKQKNLDIKNKKETEKIEGSK